MLSNLEAILLTSSRLPSAQAVIRRWDFCSIIIRDKGVVVEVAVVGYYEGIRE
jgi:hypothetical protein